MVCVCERVRVANGLGAEWLPDCEPAPPDPERECASATGRETRLLYLSFRNHFHFSRHPSFAPSRDWTPDACLQPINLNSLSLAPSPQVWQRHAH